MDTGERIKAMKQMSRYKASVSDGLMQCEVLWCRMYDTETSQKPIPNHHHSCYELHYVYEGKASVELRGRDPLVIDRAGFIIIPPYKKHSTAPASGDLEKLLYRFSIKTDIGFISDALESVNESCGIYNESPSMRKLVDIMLENASCGKKGTNTVISRLFECFLIEAFRIIAPEPERRGRDIDAKIEENQNRINDIQKYIDDNIAALITCDDVAKNMNMSLRHINRLTNEYVGVPVSKLITKCKLDYIKTLLRSSDLNLRDIADMAGFESEYSLNRFFKQHEGITIGAYRSGETCYK